MFHYRTGSRLFSYISMDGTKTPCTYFPNQNLAKALERIGFNALSYQDTFSLFYCSSGQLAGYFVFFFYNHAFSEDLPVGCLAASLEDTANFLHEFYSDYHAPMTLQADIPRMVEPGYKTHVYNASSAMIMSILSLKLEEVTVRKGVLDAQKIPAPLMEYLDTLHPFYVTFAKQTPAVRRKMKNKQHASYGGHYIRIDAHTKAAVEEYLLENGLYDDANCIMDETLYCRIRTDKTLEREIRKASGEYPDIRKAAPVAHIIHDRPVFHVKEPDKSIIFDYHALDEKASRLQVMLKLPEKERKETLLKAIGQRERLF